MKRKIIELPLHYGKTPAWLFDKMKKLSREIIYIIVSEYGKKEMLKRLVEPLWFQSFGCVLGFDWHSSGLTTVVCAAIKEGLKDVSKELGIYITGGKGKQARNSPIEIQKIAEDSNIKVDVNKLIYASRMAAKVDTAAVQDGYQLYHHSFIFTDDGDWGVIQQGMNEQTNYARRYHWLGDKVVDFVVLPHLAIMCDKRHKKVLNLTAVENKPVQQACVYLYKEGPTKINSTLKKILNVNISTLPMHHQIMLNDINPEKLYTVLLKTYQEKVATFEELLSIKGVGEKTIRALSLIAELIYSVPVSYKDPARFSFAHGGKDGYPYPIDKNTYENSIEILKEAILLSKINHTDKLRALKVLTKI